MQASRIQGNGCFLVLRQKFHTVQAVLFKGGKISKEMVKYAGSINKESYVRASLLVP
jgi:aspartyl/asparaginyl-tRNA synthetase